MSLQNNSGPRQLPCAVPYVILYGSEYTVLDSFTVILATSDRPVK